MCRDGLGAVHTYQCSLHQGNLSAGAFGRNIFFWASGNFTTPAEISMSLRRAVVLYHRFHSSFELYGEKVISLNVREVK